MPTLPPSTATPWLNDTLRGEFEALNASHMPHRADIKRVIYTRDNGASVPSWPVAFADQLCRLRLLAPAQQRLGEQPSDASRYELVFMAGQEARSIAQADRIDVVGRVSGDESFAVTLEVIGAPVISASGILVRVQAAAIRDPGNV